MKMSRNVAHKNGSNRYVFSADLKAETLSTPRAVIVKPVVQSLHPSR